MSCQHNNRIGDNYGVTCSDCGEQLEGMGNWATGNQPCIHSWYPSESGDYEYCMYCQIERQVKEYI